MLWHRKTAIRPILKGLSLYISEEWLTLRKCTKRDKVYYSENSVLSCWATLRATIKFNAGVPNTELWIRSESYNMQDKKLESLNLTVHSVSGAINIKIKRAKGNNSSQSLLIPNAFEYFGNAKPILVSTKKKPLKDLKQGRLIYKETYFCFGDYRLKVREWERGRFWHSKPDEKDNGLSTLLVVLFCSLSLVPPLSSVP